MGLFLYVTSTHSRPSSQRQFFIVSLSQQINDLSLVERQSIHIYSIFFMSFLIFLKMIYKLLLCTWLLKQERQEFGSKKSFSAILLFLINLENDFNLTVLWDYLVPCNFFNSFSFSSCDKINYLLSVRWA